MKRKKDIIKEVNKNIKKITGSIFSDVIYKKTTSLLIPTEFTQHTNFIVRFIYSNNLLHEDLLELLSTNCKLNKIFKKYKNEYHLILGGELNEFFELIKNTKNTNNKFFKEVIKNLHILEEELLGEFIKFNIINQTDISTITDNKPLQLINDNIDSIGNIIIDDIELIYNKLGICSYKEITNLVNVSYISYINLKEEINEPFSDDRIFIHEKKTLLEFIKEYYKNGDENIIKNFIRDNFDSIFDNNISKLLIYNFMCEKENVEEYKIVDEPIGEVIEEEFQIKEDEEGNLLYSDKNFI